MTRMMLVWAYQVRNTHRKSHLHFILFFAIYPSAHPAAVNPILYYSHLTSAGCVSLPFTETQTSTVAFPALKNKVPLTPSMNRVDQKCGNGKVNLLHFLWVSISHDELHFLSEALPKAQEVLLEIANERTTTFRSGQSIYALPSPFHQNLSQKM